MMRPLYRLRCRRRLPSRRWPSKESKKTGDNDQMQLTLVKSPDIIADVGALSNKPFTVGFAETVDIGTIRPRQTST